MTERITFEDFWKRLPEDYSNHLLGCMVEGEKKSFRITIVGPSVFYGMQWERAYEIISPKEAVLDKLKEELKRWDSGNLGGLSYDDVLVINDLTNRYLEDQPDSEE